MGWLVWLKQPGCDFLCLSSHRSDRVALVRRLVPTGLTIRSLQKGLCLLFRCPSTEEPRDLKQIAQQAGNAYGQVDSYIACLTRREQVNGKNNPEEVLLFKFRTQPWSVHFKWLSKESQGREVIFVKGQYESKIH